MAVSGDVAIEVARLPAASQLATSGVRAGTLPPGKVIRFESHTPYGVENPDYERIAEWMAGHKIRPIGEAWEIYVRQVEGSPDAARLTYIFYRIK
jgi:effector-binding domain-containing protein